MAKIYYGEQHMTIDFAVSELQRYVDAEIELVYDWAQLQQIEDELQIILIDELSYKEIFDVQFTQCISTDSFTIIQQQQTYYIIAKNARGLLYGVYGFWQHILGLVALELGEPEVRVGDCKLLEKTPNIINHEPLFSRRGNVLETINDATYVSNLIDWGVKNGHNEYFFTFFLWDELKATIEPLLTKRAVNVTLGGHSLRYIMAQCSAQNENLSSKAIEGAVGDLIGSKTSFANDFSIKNSHFFEQGNVIQQQVINYIVKVCQQTPVIYRISLWPEDVGIEPHMAKQFLQAYITFTERLQQALTEAGLAVQVEHIVYNAGLSWDMLERGEAKASVTSDVLYAYWGRNYAAHVAETDASKRAFEALQDWRNESTKALTVFEYYSDHFMLSELFPPLLSRIQEDLNVYQSLGCEGVINLIVPLHKKTQQQWPAYNWRWNHHLNNVIYSRLTWGDKYELIISQYFQQFGERADYYKQLILLLEQDLAPNTQWNRALFPSRVVDVQQVGKFDASLQIADQLAKVIERLADLNEMVGNNTAEEHLLSYLKDIKEIATLYESAWRMKVIISNNA
ncbi:hypothetical protein [Solibacillus sp. CAU 1738]|uniref:hypothetical protein n=1 Tax=Solibacillus sp. CAU 1738 TaxID=3140363 RepID=UPI00326171DF